MELFRLFLWKYAHPTIHTIKTTAATATIAIVVVELLPPVADAASAFGSPVSGGVDAGVVVWLGACVSSVELDSSTLAATQMLLLVAPENPFAIEIYPQ